ncbi:KGK domain-containing protein [Nostoc sp. WHI]|uniref:KGK domain-containing protein n=1 Tax=Nostoc sp. WHI TaxID=2650611 RepID=UPI0018C6F0AC|nr:KGK domain-containing protein [Nostoc sp. WHI]MBG1267762.1 hypothetical protein [Nostoc sp. WHI]
MNDFELNDDDVVFTGDDTSPNFGLTSTFKLSELTKAYKRWAAGNSNSGQPHPHAKWFTKEGVKCQFLRTQGGGWKSGKLMFRLEFIPDEPEVSQQESSKSPTDPNSPSADLRSQLDDLQSRLEE